MVKMKILLKTLFIFLIFPLGLPIVALGFITNAVIALFVNGMSLYNKFWSWLFNPLDPYL